MKKDFVKVYIEIVNIDSEDVIATSGENSFGSDYTKEKIIGWY